MKISISRLSTITGKDRSTIRKHIAGLSGEKGEKGARLYDSAQALEAIYKQERNGQNIDLKEARRKNIIADTEWKIAQTEEKQKTRIPIEVVNQVIDEVSQAMGAIIKAAKGQTMTEEKINSVFEQLRSIPASLKW